MALGPVDSWVEGLGHIHSWQVCVVQGPWVYEESSIRRQKQPGIQSQEGKAGR